jgi:hypothetical protein
MKHFPAIVLLPAMASVCLMSHGISTPPAGFAPTIQNATVPPHKGRMGMVWIPGGEFSMGCKDPRMLPEGGGEPMAGAPDPPCIRGWLLDG